MKWENNFKQYSSRNDLIILTLFFNAQPLNIDLIKIFNTVYTL